MPGALIIAAALGQSQIDYDECQARRNPSTREKRPIEIFLGGLNILLTR
jgi:hypothetical protein